MYIGAESISGARKDELRSAFSFLVGVSTDVTQLEFFKANFMSVLNDLEGWVPEGL